MASYSRVNQQYIYMMATAVQVLFKFCGTNRLFTSLNRLNNAGEVNELDSLIKLQNTTCLSDVFNKIFGQSNSSDLYSKQKLVIQGQTKFLNRAGIPTGCYI